MKFLCLHGMGTSGQILERQLASITARLDGQHEFIFVDGEVGCEAALGIGPIYPGPYSCFYDLPTPENLHAAFDLVNSVVEEDGPFDGVIGFSQGAALASSYILHDASQANPRHPFRCAIFLCASLPFNMDATPVKAAQDRTFMREIHALGFSGRVEPDAVLLQRYVPSLVAPKQRISIPTLHVIGKRDLYFDQGKNLTQVCTPHNRQVYYHTDGHELPREPRDTVKLARLIESVFYSLMMC